MHSPQNPAFTQPGNEDESEIGHTVELGPMQTIKVLLADDHDLVREGTRELLEREEDLLVVAEAGDGEEAVRLAARHSPDVVLMDIAMPKLNGIEATKEIKDISPATAVLILTAYDDDQYVFALLEAGAAGYLLKNVRGRDLVEAIRSVHAGESALHPAIARKLIDHYTHPASPPIDAGSSAQLSDRELDVLRLAAKGMSNRDIARSLHLSERTIQAHLSTIFTKMEVGSRTEAVVKALREGWLTFDETL
jgi:DNA-binding NarL/FixJ family response regulator